MRPDCCSEWTTTKIKGREGFYINQADLARYSGRSRHWLCMITRCGVLKTVRKPGDGKHVYYHFTSTIAILNKLPKRKSA